MPDRRRVWRQEAETHSCKLSLRGGSRIFRFFLVFVVEKRIDFQLYEFQALTPYLRRQVTLGE